MHESNAKLTVNSSVNMYPLSPCIFITSAGKSSADSVLADGNRPSNKQVIIPVNWIVKFTKNLLHEHECIKV